MLGEIAFDADKRRFIMVMGNAAQCMLEELHDKGFYAIVQDAMPDVTPSMLEDPVAMAQAARGVRVSALRELAWAALRKHHPEIEPEDVSELADAVGTEAWGELIGRVIAAALGKSPVDDPAIKEAGGAAKGNSRTRASARTGRA